ncbi:hypothetical protein [Ochrobactrum sp. A-1]|uniref:hypothetical protein n=1 Tax=Ochrobactrum sp. A-1 TaxID=2920940 RepID=UPI001F0A8705|nr:hypothetical protein [Ochrobactrum sp. A-1]
MNFSEAKTAWVDADGALQWRSDTGGGVIPAEHPSFDEALQALADAEVEVGDTDPAVTLDAIKAALKADVDQAAEVERLKYITPGDGQAMTYQQKIAEAKAFKTATDPQALDYPLLSSEVGITASTLAEVADVILAAFAQWQYIGAAIESARLGAKRDIDAADDEVAARAVVEAVTWPSVQVQP